MPVLKAKIMGFYGKRRIRPGETFVYPSGVKLPKWATVVPEVQKEATPESEKPVKAAAKPAAKLKPSDSDLTD